MDSDSESQDSDDGRRFRFETTRKDSAARPQPKAKASSEFNRRPSRRSRSRSKDRTSRDDRDRSSRDDRSRYSRDDSLHRGRSSNDRDINSRYSAKDRSSKESKNNSRDSSSRRHDKESRSHRSKDLRGYEAKDSRDSKDRSNNKHKSKSREKHKKHSRDRSRERVNSAEEIPKKEEKTAPSKSPTPIETEDVKVEKQKPIKKHQTEDNDKVNDKSEQKASPLASSNPKAVSDSVVSRTPPPVEAPPVRKKMKSYFDRVVNKTTIEEDSSMYGPVLPPELERKLINTKEIEEDTQKETKKVDSGIDNQEVVGPSLPNSNSASLQKQDTINVKKKPETEVIEQIPIKYQEEIEEIEEDSFGPALPSHLERRAVVGPMLPANFVLSSGTEDVANDPKSDKDDEEDNDDIVGPLPADHPAARNSYVQMQLEYRAQQVKAKFRDKTSPEKNKREEWMIELPPAHAVALGLGSINRKLKTSEGPDMSDRSMWTDTPADRLKKEREKEENRFVKSEESVKKSKKSKDEASNTEKTTIEGQPESLLDMHLKTLKKKKKKLEKEAKELGLSTRRPFDRDLDLQVNRLDDARKKKIFEKASRLNDRFTSSGKI